MEEHGVLACDHVGNTVAIVCYLGQVRGKRRLTGARFCPWAPSGFSGACPWSSGPHSTHWVRRVNTLEGPHMVPSPLDISCGQCHAWPWGALRGSLQGQQLALLLPRCTAISVWACKALSRDPTPPTSLPTRALTGPKPPPAPRWLGYWFGSNMPIWN